jgi:hypothetical protein
MSRFRMLGFAAISWLPLFAMVTGAQAQTHQSYNLASDWLASFPTTASQHAATTGTWGPTATVFTPSSGWSAGVMSFDFNLQSGPVYNPPNAAVQFLPTYYNATTGYQTSGATHIATFTYTVPFQTYQFNAGQTIQQQVGPALTHQLQASNPDYAGSKLTMPAGMTVSSSTTTSGTLQSIGSDVRATSASNAFGFGTGAFSPQSGSYNDGGGSVQDEGPAVLYNYGANATQFSLAVLNIPSGSVNDTVELCPTFGPTYVAWTAPQSGTVAIQLSGWDMHESTTDNDGFAGLLVTNSIAGVTAPMLYASQIGTGPGGGAGNLQSFLHSSVGTTSTIASIAGMTTQSTGIGWTASGISVTAGEVLYFVADNGHVEFGNHAYSGGSDSIALKTTIAFTPEPSSFVLMGLAGVGLALAAWKRRRTA